jgi:hypothetical protein
VKFAAKILLASAVAVMGVCGFDGALGSKPADEAKGRRLHRAGALNRLRQEQHLQGHDVEP